MSEASERFARGDLVAGSVITARKQTGGRGRSARQWIAGRDEALLATFVTTTTLPPSRLGLVAIAVGVAIADVCESLGITVNLKWPNDLLRNGKKLGGVLIQSRPGTPTIVFIGIGLNVKRAPDAPGMNATSLADAGVAIDPDDLVAPLVHGIRLVTAELEAGGVQQIIQRWESLAVWMNEVIEIHHPDAKGGIQRGIDEQGRLLLEIDGHIEAISVGDVERGPRPATAPYN